MLLTALNSITELFGFDKSDELKKIDEGLSALGPLLGKMKPDHIADGD